MTLIEAISVGTPVIALEYEVLSEILPNITEAIIDKYSSAGQIASLLIEIMDNDLIYSNLLRKEKQIYTERFTLEKMTQEFESYYKELCFNFIPNEN